MQKHELDARPEAVGTGSVGILVLPAKKLNAAYLRVGSPCSQCRIRFIRTFLLNSRSYCPSGQ